jgi:hypothetical protein
VIYRSAQVGTNFQAGIFQADENGPACWPTIISQVRIFHGGRFVGSSASQIYLPRFQHIAMKDFIVPTTSECGECDFSRVI